jgi:L-ascorbate metabolism protein UlaG (beta-lactamase superfamily)
MVITFNGGQCFKVSFGDTTIATNPPSKDSSLKPVKFGADIVLASLNHPDMNGVDALTYGDKKPFIISGPGEYEVRGVIIKGFPTTSTYGGVERINTTYVFMLEGMKLCFLGAHDSKVLPLELKEQTDEIDILFVPIGGDGVMSPSDAHELAVGLEPRIIIPMHYGEVGIKNALSVFLKEEGQEGVKPQEKFTIKPKDLEAKSNEVVILAS